MDRPPKFAADRTLIRLVRSLRLLGADVLCDDSLSAAEMLLLAREQNRPMLTRDKRLRTAADALYLEGHSFREQLLEVLARHPFDPHRFAFTRCSRCNATLQIVPRDAMHRRIPPFVYATHEQFAVCNGCGRVYWDATHHERALLELVSLGL
jgi:uncharacterized protein with PIN domain